MTWFLVKCTLSGILVGLISEIARRSPGLGALVASLPLVSVLGMIWLWNDTGDAGRIAAHAEATFWLVLPSLPMFLVLPALLRSGVSFWVALLLSCALTVLLYLATIRVAARFGVAI